MPGPLRTIPAWVQTGHDTDLPELPTAPDTARLTTPILKGAEPKHDAPRGRKLDWARSGELATISSPIAQNAGRWREFMSSTTIQSRPSTSRTIVDDEWMKNNWPYNFDDPWEPQHPSEQVEVDKGFWLFSRQKKKRILKRGYWQLMNNPYVPLIFRLIVLTFSVLALSLASNLFQGTTHSPSPLDDEGACRRLSSSYMAIAFDAVAILYVIYITVDEYTSEPLGLRSHSAKMRLIFLDLIFIVFNSANLALAFEPLFDSTWACHDREARDLRYSTCTQQPVLCSKQKALSGTLVVALVAWLATFAISTLRIVERAVVRDMAGRN